MKRLRVLVLMDPALVPPDSTKGYTAQEINEWKTEYDIVSTLRAAGHDVRPFGVEDELKAVRDEIDGFKPDVVFTLLEDFHGKVIYDQNVASFLELMQIPVYRMQPAWPDSGARQGPVEDAGALSPDCGAGLRGVSECAARSSGRRVSRCR